MKQVDLLKDPWPTVGFDRLIDDLDGVLHVGVDVDAGLDRRVRTLPQDLPR